ncbi:MAG: hypothetical protein N4A49_16675 [Marinifilaceae bacterium]|nr:hypothetical protein [Marinifilaceae bacterium]
MVLLEPKLRIVLADAKVIAIELQSEVNNFVEIINFTYLQKEGTLINNIISLYPKTKSGLINWIEGSLKCLWKDAKKIKRFLLPQSTNLIERKKTLNATKIHKKHNSTRKESNLNGIVDSSVNCNNSIQINNGETSISFGFTDEFAKII